jgi:recombinational DNA repair ATPase RecF
MGNEEPYSLSRLGLSGFRAYLEPHFFDFSRKPCLAVFAPNGKGKTSIVDGLEFLFSEDGTLKRLGLRKVQNQAGLEALAHNLAVQRKIPSFVSGSSRERRGLRVSE